MTAFITELKKFSDKLYSPDVSVGKKYKVLIAITQLDISLQDIHITRLGKAVKRCVKLPGEVGLLAEKIVKKWTKMIHDSEKISNNDEFEKSPINEKQVEISEEKSFNNKKNKYENSASYLKHRPSKSESDSDNSNDEIPVKNQNLKYVINSEKKSKVQNSENSFSCDSSKSDNSFSEHSEPENFNNFKSDKQFCGNNFVEKTNFLKTDKITDNELKNPTYLKSKFENNEPIMHHKYDRHNVNNKTATTNDKVNVKPDNQSQNTNISFFDDILTKNSKPVKSNKHKVENICSDKQLNVKQERISKIDIIKPSRKTEMAHATTYESLSKQSDKKRKSEVLPKYNDNNVIKKPKIQLDNNVNIFSNDLPELPTLNSSLSEDEVNEQSVINRTDLMYQSKQDRGVKTEIEDVDCTTKYESIKRVWMPTRKPGDNVNRPEENIPKIKGIPVTIIAQYDHERLMAFEGNDQNIMKETEMFWEKLLLKHHKNVERRGKEKWRDAFLRANEAREQRMRDIAERVKRNNEEKINAVNRAKILSVMPTKGNRRATDMRR